LLLRSEALDELRVNHPPKQEDGEQAVLDKSSLARAALGAEKLREHLRVTLFKSAIPTRSVVDRGIELLALAELGYVPAMLELSKLLQKYNKELSVKYRKKAAEEGNPEACLDDAFQLLTERNNDQFDTIEKRLRDTQCLIPEAQTLFSVIGPVLPFIKETREIIIRVDRGEFNWDELRNEEGIKAVTAPFVGAARAGDILACYNLGLLFIALSIHHPDKKAEYMEKAKQSFNTGYTIFVKLKKHGDGRERFWEYGIVFRGIFGDTLDLSGLFLKKTDLMFGFISLLL